MHKLTKSKSNCYRFFTVNVVLYCGKHWTVQRWIGLLKLIRSIVTYKVLFQWSEIKPCHFHFSVQLSSDLLTCETDYWLSISCFVDSRAIPNRMENVTYNLEFVLTASKEKYWLIYKYTIFTNYLIICFYTMVSHVQRCNLQSFLSFPNRNRICSLLVEKDGYRCKFRADFAMYPTFANFHNFTISLCASKQCILLKSNYKPAHHSEWTLKYAHFHSIWCVIW